MYFDFLLMNRDNSQLAVPYKRILLRIASIMQDFKRHIKEAINLNKDRLPQYAALTNNQSIPFSKRLINYEKLILSSAWLVDFIGDRYQTKGLPFVKEEFIDMESTNAFSATFPKHIDFQKPLIPYDFSFFSKVIKSAISNKSSEKIVEICNAVLLDLQSQAHVYNMTRHIIESLRRIAYLIPFHQLKAQELKIKPPTSYSWMFIKSHLYLLSRSINFDEKVSFIQEKGIPFIWQDLPSIDVKSGYDRSF